jgi:UDP-N-acetylmuramate dehydrogenase
MSMHFDTPPVRGKLLRGEALAPFTWFRVGGPADALFLPADETDLAEFLAALPSHIPVTMLGVGSNVLVRDGGIEGVVVRLAGRAWAQVTPLENARVKAGAGTHDSMLAQAAAQAGVAGLEFFVGVPGTLGAALVMNAGCYGRETKDVLVEARALTRAGEIVTLPASEFGFTYRKNDLPAEHIFLDATFQGGADTPETVSARMSEITRERKDNLIRQQKIVELKIRYRTEFREIIGEKRSSEIYKQQDVFIDQLKRMREEQIRNRLDDRPNKRFKALNQ